MAPSSEKKAAKQICDLASRQNVLTGMMEHGITISWIISRLKSFAEDGGSPVQLGCLKKLMEMMAEGGILTSANLSGTKVKEKLPADDEDQGDTVTKRTIDDIVTDNSTRRRKVNPDAHCHAEETQAA